MVRVEKPVAGSGRGALLLTCTNSEESAGISYLELYDCAFGCLSCVHSVLILGAAGARILTIW